ncbi:MAG: methyltransferase domain-containing protein [Candidatus Omnitrophica bacterium]|nr:methyltransferase domain-containing protein [Candidatus Omnitrophota bacterium]
MREEYYAQYYEFENNNWWFVSRRKILRALLAKYLPEADSSLAILDAGCGTGINLALLSEFGEVVGVDRSGEAIRFCRLRNAANVRQAEIIALPFDNEAFDLATALDVLEHIPDDRKAVSEIVRVCKPGGHVLITVPVFPSLWCEHDEINQHVRRYEPPRIRALASEQGLTIVHQSFMNTWLLPAALIWRWRKQFLRLFAHNEDLARADNMHHHPWINNLLTAVFSSEAPLVAGPGLPIGLSLVILAKKT